MPDSGRGGSVVRDGASAQATEAGTAATCTIDASGEHFRVQGTIKPQSSHFSQEFEWPGHLSHMSEVEVPIASESDAVIPEEFAMEKNYD